MPDRANTQDREALLRHEVEENARGEHRCARFLLWILVLEAAALWKYAGNKPWHETTTFMLCTLGLAAAVFGELIFETRRSKAQEELQLISDQKVAASNERAAEANQKAEEAMLALAMYWTPRVLSDDEINRIADKLRPYAGVKYVGGVSFSHPEFIALLGYIEEALEDAGWIEIDCPNPRRIPREGKPYICDAAPAIRVRIEVLTKTRPLAIDSLVVNAGVALRNALNAEPKGLEARFGVTWEDPLPGEIATMYVMIGPKI